MMNLDVPTIVEAYSQGYFLMADDDDLLGWYQSRERTLIPLDDRFHYPKSLQRVLNQQRFQVTINKAFDQVVEGCADRSETWISPQLKQIYRELHQAGVAHSFETWQGDKLAGGILGIVIRGAFIGESMFFKIPEGSKVALVKLVEHLRDRQFELFDAQLMNPHLERFGAYVMSADDYEQRLKVAIAKSCRFV
jgi:leucyl/phenylalanyl-tRNA---protein transferase